MDNQHKSNQGFKIALTQAIRESEPSHKAIPPLGPAYLASYLTNLHPEIEINYFSDIDKLLEYAPQLVSVSSVTENLPQARELARIVKSRIPVPVVLGGPHISTLPQSLPEEFDLGVVGEGEVTFAELVELFIQNSRPQQLLAQLPGIVFRNHNRLMVTPTRPSIADLTSLPFPAREIYGWNKFMYMMTSRGCPYRCIFCSPKVMWKKYRNFTAEYLVAEIKEIIAHSSCNYIHFFDDLFVADRKRLKRIVELLKNENLNQVLHFGGHIRANLMDEELGTLLKEMNFVSGAFGAESASPRILKKLKYGTTTVAENQRTLDICHQMGILASASFVIGTPGETAQDLELTLKFIDQNRSKISALEVFILLPYPGTPLWDWALKEGLVSPDMDWGKFATDPFFSEMNIPEDFLYLNQEHMPRPELLKYAGRFQKLDQEINRDNKNLYKNLASL